MFPLSQPFTTVCTNRVQAVLLPTVAALNFKVEFIEDVLAFFFSSVRPVIWYSVTVCNDRAPPLRASQRKLSRKIHS